MALDTNKMGLHIFAAYDLPVIGMALELAECRCGCGTLVSVASRSRLTKGIRKGDALFAHGHGRRQGAFGTFDRQAQTKVCTRCPERGPQPLANFHKRVTSPDGHVWVCKRCRSIDSQQVYADRTDAQKQKEIVRQQRRLQANRDLVVPRLNEGCLDCGNRNWCVLDFHHRDATTKEMEIAYLIRSASAMRLQAELDKCDVICTNCHRIRTSAEFNWWKAGDALSL